MDIKILQSVHYVAKIKHYYYYYYYYYDCLRYLFNWPIFPEIRPTPS